MKTKKAAKTRLVRVVVTPEEYLRLQTRFQKTTCRFFSEYLRTLLRRKPVTVLHRNASLDEFLPVAHRIKNELEDLRKNFAQAVTTLQTAPAGHLGRATEFLLSEEVILIKAIEDIRLTMIKISEKCME